MDLKDFPQAPTNNATDCQATYGGTYQQCQTCWQWHFGWHICSGFQSPSTAGIAAWSTATPIITADVERIVAKALEDHTKKYLAIIEKLADALAGKK